MKNKTGLGWLKTLLIGKARDLSDQQLFHKISLVAVLATAGASPERLVRLTWFVTSRDEYNAALTEIGVAYRELIGGRRLQSLVDASVAEGGRLP